MIRRATSRRHNRDPDGDETDSWGYKRNSRHWDANGFGLALQSSRPVPQGFVFRTKPAFGNPAQDVMTSVLKGSESVSDDRGTCVDEALVAGDGQSTFLAQLGFT